MINDESLECYVHNGVPMRRLRDIGYQEYIGGGGWETLCDQEDAERVAILISHEDCKGLIEALDLGAADEQFNEEAWRFDFAAQDEDVRRAARKFHLSRGETERARGIASFLCASAQREVGRKGRLRPRTALAALHAATAEMERWSQQQENVLFDRHLPPHESEDTRFRVHVFRRLGPGWRIIGRSPHGAAVVLLARGVEGVRRFVKQPFPKAMKHFKRRCVMIPQDSDEATNLRYRDNDRWDKAVATWQALGRAEEECLLALLTAFGVECDTLVGELRMKGAT